MNSSSFPGYTEREYLAKRSQGQIGGLKLPVACYFRKCGVTVLLAFSLLLVGGGTTLAQSSRNDCRLSNDSVTETARATADGAWTPSDVQSWMSENGNRCGIELAQALLSIRSRWHSVSTAQTVLLEIGIPSIVPVVDSFRVDSIGENSNALLLSLYSQFPAETVQALRSALANEPPELLLLAIGLLPAKAQLSLVPAVLSFVESASDMEGYRSRIEILVHITETSDAVLQEALAGEHEGQRCSAAIALVKRRAKDVLQLRKVLSRCLRENTGWQGARELDLTLARAFSALGDESPPEEIVNELWEGLFREEPARRAAYVSLGNGEKDFDGYSPREGVDSALGDDSKLDVAARLLALGATNSVAHGALLAKNEPTNQFWVALVALQSGHIDFANSKLLELALQDNADELASIAVFTLVAALFWNESDDISVIQASRELIRKRIVDVEEALSRLDTRALSCTPKLEVIQEALYESLADSEYRASSLRVLAQLPHCGKLSDFLGSLPLFGELDEDSRFSILSFLGAIYERNSQEPSSIERQLLANWKANSLKAMVDDLSQRVLSKREQDPVYSQNMDEPTSDYIDILQISVALFVVEASGVMDQFDDDQLREIVKQMTRATSYQYESIQRALTRTSIEQANLEIEARRRKAEQTLERESWEAWWLSGFGALGAILGLSLLSLFVTPYSTRLRAVVFHPRWSQLAGLVIGKLVVDMLMRRSEWLRLAQFRAFRKRYQEILKRKVDANGQYVAPEVGYESKHQRTPGGVPRWQRVFDELLQDDRSLWAIQGPSGLGKTALLEQWASYASDMGNTVLLIRLGSGESAGHIAMRMLCHQGDMKYSLAATEEILGAGGFVVLLDGYNEDTDPDSTSVFVRALIRRNLVLMTSQHAFEKERRWSGVSVQKIHLQPFGKPQLETLFESEGDVWVERIMASDYLSVIAGRPHTAKLLKEYVRVVEALPTRSIEVYELLFNPLMDFPGTEQLNLENAAWEMFAENAVMLPDECLTQPFCDEAVASQILTKQQDCRFRFAHEQIHRYLVAFHIDQYGTPPLAADETVLEFWKNKMRDGLGGGRYWADTLFFLLEMHLARGDDDRLYEFLLEAARFSPEVFREHLYPMAKRLKLEHLETQDWFLRATPLLVQKTGTADELLEKRRVEILVFAANAKNHSQLDLATEVREIEDTIRSARFPKDLVVITKWAVRREDLLQALNEHTPQVIHFSGHGGDSGIYLTNKNGNGEVLPEKRVARLFSVFEGAIRLVVFNMCDSASLAKVVTANIDCAIGMNGAIDDASAIEFSASFYRAIGFGCSVQAAFEQGKLAIRNEVDATIPVLECKRALDATQVVLVANAELVQVTTD